MIIQEVPVYVRNNLNLQSCFQGMIKNHPPSWNFYHLQYYRTRAINNLSRLVTVIKLKHNLYVFLCANLKALNLIFELVINGTGTIAKFMCKIYCFYI